MELSVVPIGEEMPGGRIELQVAQWTNGSVIIPHGRFRPQTLSTMSGSESSVSVDILPILEPIDPADGSLILWLAIGLLENWDSSAGMVQLTSMDASAGILSRVTVTLE